MPKIDNLGELDWGYSISDKLIDELPMDPVDVTKQIIEYRRGRKLLVESGLSDPEELNPFSEKFFYNSLDDETIESHLSTSPIRNANGRSTIDLQIRLEKTVFYPDIPGTLVCYKNSPVQPEQMPASALSEHLTQKAIVILRQMVYYLDAEHAFITFNQEFTCDDDLSDFGDERQITSLGIYIDRACLVTDAEQFIQDLADKINFWLKNCC